MTKEKYLELKSHLKQLAHSIRNHKINYKAAQKEFSNCERLHGTRTAYECGRISEEIWEKYVKPYWNAHYWEVLKLGIRVLDLKEEYRYCHIVYSMARGKTYKQIESKTRDDNKVSWPKINRYKRLWEA
jgi:hypothetical protein